MAREPDERRGALMGGLRRLPVFRNKRPQSFICFPDEALGLSLFKYDRC